MCVKYFTFIGGATRHMNVYVYIKYSFDPCVVLSKLKKTPTQTPTTEERDIVSIAEQLAKEEANWKKGQFGKGHVWAGG